MPNKPKKALMYSIKAKPRKAKKMEPLEPLLTKDDYMDEIDSELSKYEDKESINREPLYREDVNPDASDMIDEMQTMSSYEPELPELGEPMEPIEYVGPGSPRRKRYEEQMQTEKDAAPMRTLRAAKEGFVEGAKEGINNVKKFATDAAKGFQDTTRAVAEGTGIPTAYRAARSAIKSVGKMASETNRSKGSKIDPAIQEFSDMITAGVVTEGDLARYRKAMKMKKGSMK